jgi:hypothetical protein
VQAIISDGALANPPAAPNPAGLPANPPRMTPDFRAQDQLFIPGPAFLLEEQDRYRLFARTVMPLLIQARPALAKAYCANDGRPPIDPALLLGVTVLQFWEGVPDTGRPLTACATISTGATPSATPWVPRSSIPPPWSISVSGSSSISSRP